MKTGIESIAKERQEQIEKHGYDLEWDKVHSDDSAINLINAAMYCLHPTMDHYYPKGWDEKQKHKLRQKPRIERVATAGAFCAAAIDRMNNKKSINE